MTESVQTMRLSQARPHAWLDGLVLAVYHGLPLPLKTKTGLRNFLFRHVPFPFKRTNGYWRWAQTEKYLSDRRRHRPPMSWGLMAAPHMTDTARLVERRLRDHGWKTELLTDAPGRFVHDLYLVIYPNEFETLPPAGKLVPFHAGTETDALRFSDARMTTMRHSFAVLESSISGMEELEKRGISYPSVHHLPLEDEEKFVFMFDRFLMATDLLPDTHAYDMSVPIRSSIEHVATSMPERFDRRFSFLENTKTLDMEIGLFDGIRRRPGWIGNALSQSVLAGHALRNDMKRFTVMEDDVVFPDGFDDRLSIVHEFLDSRAGEWDVFSGVMTRLPYDMKISQVVEFRGQVFILLNKMNSTVYNIYSTTGLRILASWHPDRIDNDDSHMDQYLTRRNGLRVVTTCPFLVKHETAGSSTMYRHGNEVYFDAISRTEERFRQVVRRSR